jgi:hypothetical protein
LIQMVRAARGILSARWSSGQKICVSVTHR